jgi:DMSO reductase anchor subunit
VKPEAGTTGKFHELPLVLFTALATISAGLLAGHFGAWALGYAAWSPSVPVGWTAVLLLTAGMAASLLHLGRPAKMALSLNRTGRSRLSTEVLLALLVLAGSAGALCWPGNGTFGEALWAIAAPAAPALLFYIGHVYRLPGQLSWKGAAAISPLLLGFALGACIEAGRGGMHAPVLALALGAVVLDALGFGLRWFSFDWDAEVGVPAYPKTFERKKRLLILRLLDANLLPAGFLLAEMPLAAAAMLAVGIFAERYVFYALAVRRTPESEIARVERHIS